MVAGLALLAAATCAAAAGPSRAAERDAATALTAAGHEPSWRLVAGEDGLVLQVPQFGVYFKSATARREAAGTRIRITAAQGGRRLAAVAGQRLCADTMTGMPFPLRVTVEFEGRTLRGCGGDTLAAIEGGWRIVGLEDGPAPDGAPLAIAFRRDGQVSGRSGCNRFTGGFRLTGEGLAFGPLAATRMACPEPAMRTEARLLALLGGVTRVTPGEGARLRLMAGDRQALVLERVR